MPQKKEAEKGPLSDPNEGETQEQFSLYVDVDDWPKGLPRFLRRMGWTADQWQETRKHWLERPNDLTTRDWLLYTTDKKKRYKEAPKLAVERQKTLRPGQWMTAFLLAEDSNTRYIAKSLHVEADYVEDLIRELKDIADVDTRAGIVRWFLGL
jgi:hypothetical protein